MNFLISVSIVLVVADANLSYGQVDSLIDNQVIRGVGKMLRHCDHNEDTLRCLKIQAIKFLGRALNESNIKVSEGIVISRITSNNSNPTDNSGVRSNDIERISSKGLNNIMLQQLTSFMNTRELQLNIPKITVASESRGKKKKSSYLGPFIGTILLKVGMLKLAYHAIALIATKALIAGKIALIISVIIGLKKLVSSGEHEKTTYEIVKHPHIKQSQTTFSSSHSHATGEYDTGGHDFVGNGYHRTLPNEEMLMQEKAYRAHYPRIQ